MVQCNRCNLQYRESQKFVRLLYKSVTQYDIYFLFCSPKCSNSLLVFANILKDKPSQRKNTQLRGSRNMYFYLLIYQLKKFVKKKWKNPNVGW